MTKKFWLMLGCGVAAVVLAPVILGILFFLLWSLTMYNGQEYRGEYPAAYTVAINSFFGSYGSGSNGEITLQSNIGILETDQYGRILFYYHEGLGPTGCGYAIMQKEQDGYAYYYEDDCAIGAIDDWNGNGPMTHEEWFTQEEIDALKKLNDWDQPLNEDKCTKKEIITRKGKSKIQPSDSDYTRAAKACFDQSDVVYTMDTSVGYERFFTSDAYGREIHYLCCSKKRSSGSYEYFDIAVIFNPDGTFSRDTGVVMIEDMGNYQEALKELKRNNDWNTEFQGS